MIYLILVLSVLAGAATVLAFKLKHSFIRLLLSFSGAYLLSVTVLHLLPEAYHHSSTNIGLFILFGIIIQSVLESFSKGAEHGHIHLHTESSAFPWLLFISLSVHAFSEGIPVAHSHDHSLLWAIVVHKIPISMVLATFLVKSNISKKYAFAFILLFALMSPLGALLSEKIIFFTKYHKEITAVIIGIFLHISTIILFESSENHKFNLIKFIVILLGIGVAFFV